MLVERARESVGCHCLTEPLLVFSRNWPKANISHLTLFAKPSQQSLVPKPQRANIQPVYIIMGIPPEQMQWLTTKLVEFPSPTIDIAQQIPSDMIDVIEITLIHVSNNANSIDHLHLITLPHNGRFACTIIMIINGEERCLTSIWITFNRRSYRQGNRTIYLLSFLWLGAAVAVECWPRAFAPGVEVVKTGFVVLFVLFVVVVVVLPVCLFVSSDHKRGRALSKRGRHRIPL